MSISSLSQYIICVLFHSLMLFTLLLFFFSSRRRHTRYWRDWSSDVCSSDLRAFAVLSTINADGSPQSSVIWATYEADQVVFSTILGRRKTRNMERDARVSLCVDRKSVV